VPVVGDVVPRASDWLRVFAYFSESFQEEVDKNPRGIDRCIVNYITYDNTNYGQYELEIVAVDSITEIIGNIGSGDRRDIKHEEMLRRFKTQDVKVLYFDPHAKIELNTSSGKFKIHFHTREGGKENNLSIEVPKLNIQTKNTDKIAAFRIRLDDNEETKYYVFGRRWIFPMETVMAAHMIVEGIATS